MSLVEPQIDLLGQARNGDPAAFGRLVELYQRLVWRLAYRMTFDREDAAELVQEVFLRLFQNFHQYQPGSRFGPWFMKLALNTCINEAKKRRRRSWAGNLPDESAESVPSKEPDAVAVLEARQRQRAVRSAIELLEPSKGHILTLRYIEDLSYKDIGDILELPEGTVKTRLFRARAALRQSLERTGVLS